jgi:serine/threonine protein kinase
VAPEILKSESYGKEVDLWSIGVILYILLCGFPPFYSERTDELYNQIKRGEYEFPDPYWTEISFAAKDLVRKLLTVNPKRRYTAEQSLKHPWISGNAAPARKFGGGHTQRIKLLQARRTLRRAVQTIIALNRFALNIPAASS